jgi:hypothetical protein
MPNRLTGSARLHVVAVFFNHYRSKNLLSNFQKFAAHMKDLGVTLYTVEAVLNDSEFEVTEAGNPYHVQKRVKYELFRKENLQNIGVHRAIELHGDDVKYLAMVDADVTFINQNIVEDTISQLNRHKVVQMWSTAVDLGPEGRPLALTAAGGSVVSSFACCYESVGVDLDEAGNVYTSPGTAITWHPGYCWAFRRRVWEEMNGFFDISILGAGDHHMAWAFAGVAGKGIHSGTSEGYKTKALEHLTLIKEVVNGDLGAVPGLIVHSWHGAKSSRRYVERWQILIDNGFDPNTDLVRRHDGLLELAENKPRLRDGIRRYFALRNDDCNVTPDFFKQQL